MNDMPTPPGAAPAQEPMRGTDAALPLNRSPGHRAEDASRSLRTDAEAQREAARQARAAEAARLHAERDAIRQAQAAAAQARANARAEAEAKREAIRQAQAAAAQARAEAQAQRDATRQAQAAAAQARAEARAEAEAKREAARQAQEAAAQARTEARAEAEAKREAARQAQEAAAQARASARAEAEAKREATRQAQEVAAQARAEARAEAQAKRDATRQAQAAAAQARTEARAEAQAKREATRQAQEAAAQARASARAEAEAKRNAARQAAAQARAERAAETARHRERTKAALGQEVRVAGHTVFYSDAGAKTDSTAVVVSMGEPKNGGAWLRHRSLDCPTIVCGLDPKKVLLTDLEFMAAEMLRTTGRDQATGPILVTGVSLPGFAALLLGALFAAAHPHRPVRVIALSPPTQIWPARRSTMSARFTEALDLIAGHPEAARRIARYGDLRPWVEAAARAAGPNFKATIVVGERHKPDVAAAERLADIPGVEVMGLPTNLHNTLFWLNVPLSDRAALEKSFKALVPPVRNLAKAEQEEHVRQQVSRHVDELIAFRTERNLDLNRLLKGAI